MKKKTFRGSEKKLNKIEAYQKHFGWQTVSNDGDKLVMSFDNDIRHAKNLKKLEKQAKIIRRKFPVRMIPWLILGAIFLVPYFFYKDGILFGVIDLNSVLSFIPSMFDYIRTTVVNFLPIFLVAAGSLCAFFSLYEFLVFWFVKFSKNSSLEAIFKEADAFSGNVIDAPLEGNVLGDGPNTGILSKLGNIGKQVK